MASLVARAARNHDARQRLDTALQRVSKRLDIPIPDESRRMRDPDLQPIVEIERFATFVEAIDERLETMAEGDEAPEGRESWTVPMLRAYAAEHDIEIPGDVRKKVDIAEYIESVEAMRAAERESEKDIDVVDDDASDQESDGAPGPDADTGAAADPVTPEGEGAGLHPGTGTVAVTPDGGQVVVKPREGSDQQPGDVVAPPERRRF